MNPAKVDKKIDAQMQADKKYAESFDGSLQSQFKQHRVGLEDKKSAVVTQENQLINTSGMSREDIAAMIPGAKVLGLNEMGRPTAYFVYGSDRTTEREFEADVDLAKVVEGNKQVIKCVGMQLLCPKCGSPLYVKGAGLDNGKEIIIHWDKMVQSNIDKKFRPIVTVVGDFTCDYSDAEITGVRKSRASNVIMRCNWRGGIIEGRCFDHTPKIIGATT